jgi:hypothetical protein
MWNTHAGEPIYMWSILPMRAEPTDKLAVNWVSWHIGITPGTGLSHLSYDVSAVKKTLPLPTLHRFVYSTYC